MAKTNIKLTVSSPEEFFDRMRTHARALDRGELPAAGVTISFEDPLEMLKVLSAERVRLLHRIKQSAMQVSALALELNRDVRAVSRDVALLERTGLVRTSYRANPGHGRMRIVEPVAQQYKLVANL